MGNLTDQQKAFLSKYFINSEVKAFDNAKTPKGNPQPNIFGTEPFQSMIRSRKAFISDMIDKGLRPSIVKKMIIHWYKLKKSRSPFDWLKIEYKPGRKLSQAQLAKQLEMRKERKSFKTVVSRGAKRMRDDMVAKQRERIANMDAKRQEMRDLRASKKKSK